MGAEDGERLIAVWDLPIRVCHWLAVALVAAAYATERLNWMDWHVRAGYALLAVLLFRVAWGFVGGETARFARFLAPPRLAARHLAHLFRRERDTEVGHNPAGGWMVVALLALMLGQTLSGLYVSNDIADEGPLTEIVSAPLANAIEAAHDRFLWDALLAAIVLHIAAILVYAAIKRHDLVRPVVTGRKRLRIGIRPPALAGAMRAVIVLAGSLAATAAVIRFL